jgi:hypothetical protein
MISMSSSLVCINEEVIASEVGMGGVDRPREGRRGIGHGRNLMGRDGVRWGRLEPWEHQK